MSDDDLVYPSDGDGSEEQVYDYGSDAEENEAGEGDSDGSSSSSSSSSSKSGSGSSSSSKSGSGSDSDSSDDDDANVPLEIKLENIFYLAEDKFSEGDYSEALQDFLKITTLEVRACVRVPVCVRGVVRRRSRAFSVARRVVLCASGRLGRFPADRPASAPDCAPAPAPARASDGERGGGGQAQGEMVFPDAAEGVRVSGAPRPLR
jgi:hypothetical protein